MGLKWLSVTIIIRNLFLLKVQGGGLSIKAGGLFYSRVFGAVKVFYIWGFIISEMGKTLKIGGSKDGGVCPGAVFCAGVFCVE